MTSESATFGLVSVSVAAAIALASLILVGPAPAAHACSVADDFRLESHHLDGNRHSDVALANAWRDWQAEAEEVGIPTAEPPPKILGVERLTARSGWRALAGVVDTPGLDSTDPQALLAALLGDEYDDDSDLQADGASPDGAEAVDADDDERGRGVLTVLLVAALVALAAAAMVWTARRNAIAREREWKHRLATSPPAAPLDDSE